MLNIGPAEIALIAMVALLLFGRRVPEVMRNLGKGVSEFKKGIKEVQEDIEKAAEEAPTTKVKDQGDKELKG